MERHATDTARTHARMGGTGRAVEIRAFRASDARTVADLTLQAYDSYGTITGDYRNYLADPVRRAAGSSALLVAGWDGEVVGTVTYVVPDDEAWEGPEPAPADASFRVLAVAPHAEGRGVGTALVRRCLQMAREQGRHRLMIVSMVWMTRAHALYRHLGFVQRPDLDVRFPGGAGVMFQRDLTDDAAARFPPPGPAPDEPPWFEDAWAR
jgi:GNAT superfamily N-acetyltransferase